METNETPTKVCSKCGQSKPLSEYYRNHNAKDGLQCWCKQCNNESVYERCRREKSPAPMLDPAAFHDPRTQGLTPRDLIDELAARGYHGTLEYTEVKVHRIKV